MVPAHKSSLAKAKVEDQLLLYTSGGLLLQNWIFLFTRVAVATEPLSTEVSGGCHHLLNSNWGCQILESLKEIFVGLTWHGHFLQIWLQAQWLLDLAAKCLRQTKVMEPENDPIDRPWSSRMTGPWRLTKVPAHKSSLAKAKVELSEFTRIKIEQFNMHTW